MTTKKSELVDWKKGFTILADNLSEANHNLYVDSRGGEWVPQVGKRGNKSKSEHFPSELFISKEKYEMSNQIHLRILDGLGIFELKFRGVVPEISFFTPERGCPKLLRYHEQVFRSLKFIEAYDAFLSQIKMNLRKEHQGYSSQGEDTDTFYMDYDAEKQDGKPVFELDDLGNIYRAIVLLEGEPLHADTTNVEIMKEKIQRKRRELSKLELIV